MRSPALRFAAPARLFSHRFRCGRCHDVCDPRAILESQRRTHRSTRLYDPARNGPDLVVASLQILTVVALILLIAAGLFGNPATFKNITPVAVWVIWWVGFGFLTAFVGNIWPLINPWSSVFGFAETLARPWTSRFSFHAHYPRWLGVWPSCVLFLLFAWLELVAPSRDVPRNVAIAILIYSVFTWTGFVTFGRNTWLKNGEVFSIAFGLFGRFAPLNFTNDGRWRVSLRPFATGLLTRTPLEPSMTAFSLLMLGTVTVDGFMETPLWAAVVERVLTDPGRVDANPWAYMAMQTALLIAGPLTLTGLYLVVIALMAQISGSNRQSCRDCMSFLSYPLLSRITFHTIFRCSRSPVSSSSHLRPTPSVTGGICSAQCFTGLTSVSLMRSPSGISRSLLL